MKYAICFDFLDDQGNQLCEPLFADTSWQGFNVIPGFTSEIGKATRFDTYADAELAVRPYDRLLRECATIVELEEAHAA